MKTKSPQTPRHSYGNNIRKWRMLKEIKQCQLATHLHITEGAMSNIENNKTDITLSRLETIASFLNISVENLLKEPAVLMQH